MARALITGVTGQDASCLAECLLAKSYGVYGMVRRSSTENFERIKPIRDSLRLTQADLLDPVSLIAVLSDVHPHEAYNMTAQSSVATSWAQSVLTAEFEAIEVIHLVEAFRHVGRDWRDCVREDPALKHSAEVDLLAGDATKTRATLGWQPRVSLGQLVGMMVDVDLHRCASA